MLRSRTSLLISLHPAKPVGPSLSLPLAMCEADSVRSAAQRLELSVRPVEGHQKLLEVIPVIDHYSPKRSQASAGAIGLSGVLMC